jgi:hypothetical protein
MTKRIEAMWAFVAIDPKEDGEGLIAGDILKGFGPVPFIGADEERVRALRPLIEKMAAATGIQIRLVKFTGRVEIEVFGKDEQAHGRRLN